MLTIQMYIFGTQDSWVECYCLGWQNLKREELNQRWSRIPLWSHFFSHFFFSPYTLFYEPFLYIGWHYLYYFQVIVESCVFQSIYIPSHHLKKKTHYILRRERCKGPADLFFNIKNLLELFSHIFCPCSFFSKSSVSCMHQLHPIEVRYC